MSHHTRGSVIAVLTILAVTLSACGFPLPAKQIETQESVTVDFVVFADQAWQDTGVNLQPGNTLTVEFVEGLWSPWPGGFYDGIGSGGDPRCSCNVMMAVSHAALIGKIGDGNPFLVGNSFTQKVGETGKLFLGINDSRLGDNSGSLSVRITITP